MGDSFDNIREEKKSARKIILFRRRELTVSEWEKKSALIFQNILSQGWYRKSEKILTFVDQDNEPDTRGIILHAFNTGREVYVPVTDKDNMTMEFYRIKSLSQLEKGNYGLMEPEPIKENLYIPENETKNTVIFIPGAAFDRSGHRVGYGGGFYDKYLERIKNGPFRTISPVFDFQMIDHVPYEPHDSIVQCIVTESGIIGITDHEIRLSFKD